MKALRNFEPCDASADAGVLQAPARSTWRHYIACLVADKWFEWSAVQQFRFTSPALPLLFATLGDGDPHPLEIERPALSRSEVVELDDKENVFGAEASSRVELYQEESSCFVFGEGGPPAPQARKMGLKKRKLPSSMISTGRYKEQNRDAWWRRRRRRSTGTQN